MGWLAACGPAAAEPLLARVGEREVTIAQVDARCGAPCDALRAELRDAEGSAIQALADEAALAGLPTLTPPAITEQEVDAFIATRSDELDRGVARDRAAARFYLWRERAAAERHSQIVAARKLRPVRFAPTPAAGASLDGLPPETELARVAEQKITLGAVEERAAWPLFRVRGALARERRRHLDLLIEEALWEAEAKRTRVTVQALKANVRAEAAPVTDADVDAYFANEVQRREPAARKFPERIRALLEFRTTHAANQAFLERARSANRVEILLSEPRPPRLQLEVGALGWIELDRATGWRRIPDPKRGRVVLLTSVRGAVSREVWGDLEQLARETGAAVAVRPLLPQWDPEATAVFACLYCAREHLRFPELVAAVLSAPELPAGKALDALLARVLEPRDQTNAARSCRASEAAARAIAEESALAERLGIDQPPVLLVNGRVLGGRQDMARLRAAVAEATP